MKPLLLAALCGSLLMAGCGSDTVDDTPSSPEGAEGLHSGFAELDTDVVAASRTFHALVPANSSLWLVYTNAAGELAGALQGSGTVNTSAGTYTAAALTERNASGTLAGAMTATFVTRSRLSANVLSNPGGVPRELSLNPANAVTYSTAYENAPATLPVVATAYPGAALTEDGVEEATLTLDRNAATAGEVLRGEIGPLGDVCVFTGSVVATPSGNYFVVTLTFPGGPSCVDRGLTGSVGGVLFSAPNGKRVLVGSNSKLAFLGN